MPEIARRPVGHHGRVVPAHGSGTRELKMVTLLGNRHGDQQVVRVTRPEVTVLGTRWIREGG